MMGSEKRHLARRKMLRSEPNSNSVRLCKTKLEEPNSNSVRLCKAKREEHGSSLRSEHSHEISGATPTERLFVSTNRTLTRYDEKRIGVFIDSKRCMHRIIAGKRKPTHKEKAEAEGWIFLE
jgi:hypothetical protein